MMSNLIETKMDGRIINSEHLKNSQSYNSSEKRDLQNTKFGLNLQGMLISSN